MYCALLWASALSLAPVEQDRTLKAAPLHLLAPAAALVLFSRRQGCAGPAVQACTTHRPFSPSKLESVWLVRIPKGPPHLRLALLVLLGNFIIKRVKARARPVTQAYSAAALVSRLSIVDALQDCFHLLAPSHLHARPAR
jgi:hypothetical protein